MHAGTARLQASRTQHVPQKLPQGLLVGGEVRRGAAPDCKPLLNVWLAQALA